MDLCRPLKVVVEDCRFLINGESRNAVWAAVHHIHGGLRLPRKYWSVLPASRIAQQIPPKLLDKACFHPLQDLAFDDASDCTIGHIKAHVPKFFVIVVPRILFIFL